MKEVSAKLLIAAVSIVCLAAPVQAGSYSQIVQQNCAADYKRLCGDYGLETPALRSCMDRNGQSLSKPCVQALVKSGEVSQAEVNKRKSSGH